MRLKWFLFSCLMAIAAVFCGKAQAKEQQPQASQPSAETASVAQPKTPEEALLAQLNGTQWSLKLTPSNAAKEQKPVNDTVSFNGRKITSEFLSKSGYPSSNFSLSMGGDGKGVWETMQTKEGEGVAFWRGEIDGSTMRGVLSKHPVEGNPEDYSFAGQVTGGKTITMPANPAATQPSAAQAASSAPSSGQASVSSGSAKGSTSQEKEPEKTDKKKKKRWF